MEVASLILSVFAFGFSLFVFIDIMAQKKSTHQIQVIDPTAKALGIDNKLPKDLFDDMVEFDQPDPSEVAINEMKKRNVT